MISFDKGMSSFRGHRPGTVTRFKILLKIVYVILNDLELKCMKMESGQKLMSNEALEGLITQNTDIRFQRKPGDLATLYYNYNVNNF